jgi:hypothetical protein
MSRRTEVTGRIVAIERLANTYNGNPRYRITLQMADGFGTWNTAADHAFTYAIGNIGLRVDNQVWLTIGGRGTVEGISAR